MGILSDNDSLINSCSFFRTFSSRGISYTFNAESFWDTYKKTPRSETFYKIMYQKSSKCFGNRQVEPPGTHHLKRFEALVSVPKVGIKSRLMTIHDPARMPDFESQVLRLLPGRTYDIRVTPSQMRLDDNLGSIEKTQKGCHAGVGQTSNLFKRYSQSGCIFECKLRNLHKRYKCFPWDLPHLFNSSFCSKRDEQDFMVSLGSYSIPLGCDCPIDCEATQYSFSVDSETTDPLHICTDRELSEWMNLDRQSWARNEVHAILESKYNKK